MFARSFVFCVFVFQSASGPGLTFIAFTEAIVKMPASPIWSVLFFCMLLTLGLGSMFGTLEGVITPFYDLKIVPFRKEIMTGMYTENCLKQSQNFAYTCNETKHTTEMIYHCIQWQMTNM